MTELSGQGRRLAVATIVSVTGSTYRGPGARLLIPDEGDSVGNISAGCLEDDVAKVAREVMEDGEPRLISFDLTADDEAVWGWGLGCNGVIDVFVEPADNAVAIASALRTAIEENRPISSVTVIESNAAGVEKGARVIVHPDGRREGTLGHEVADLDAVEAGVAASATGNSTTHVLSLEAGDVRVFIEALEPPLRLLVCGAGHDAIPLVRFAAALGWRVGVLDDREVFLTKDRFPEASSFLETEPLQAAKSSGADANTHAVVMSHNYLRDKDYLRSFIESDVTYIGMLGPRRRLERLLDALRTEGVEISEGDIARIYGPAGLDLGSEGPEEIAASIVSQILAVKRRRSGGFLRDLHVPIHNRPAGNIPG